MHYSFGRREGEESRQQFEVGAFQIYKMLFQAPAACVSETSEGGNPKIVAYFAITVITKCV